MLNLKHDFLNEAKAFNLIQLLNIMLHPPPAQETHTANSPEIWTKAFNLIQLLNIMLHPPPRTNPE